MGGRVGVLQLSHSEIASVLGVGEVSQVVLSLLPPVLLIESNMFEQYPNIAVTNRIESNKSSHESNRIESNQVRTGSNRFEILEIFVQFLSQNGQEPIW